MVHNCSLSSFRCIPSLLVVQEQSKTTTKRREKLENRAQSLFLSFSLTSVLCRKSDAVDHSDSADDVKDDGNDSAALALAIMLAAASELMYTPWFP